MKYSRGALIYSDEQLADRLFLVISGTVKVFTASEQGSNTVMALCGADDFFGEEAFVGGQHRTRAMALNKTTLMSWSRSEIEEQIQRQPRLGQALVQRLVQRSMELEERLRYIALDKVPNRVIITLIRLAKDGHRNPDGSVRVRIADLTQSTLAEYIGTSREMVAAEMNRLRRLGVLCYSRREMEFYPETLVQYVNERRNVKKASSRL